MREATKLLLNSVRDREGPFVVQIGDLPEGADEALASGLLREIRKRGFDCLALTDRGYQALGLQPPRKSLLARLAG